MTRSSSRNFFPPRAPASSIAVVGAGIAGIACARTLMQAGHRVTVFEKSAGAGGRMSTRRTEFGGFDHGAQYFTVRDARFRQLLQLTPDLVRPWSANTVRILDELGRIPKIGETVLWRGYKLEVVDMDGQRIDRIMLSVVPKQTKATE